MIRVTSGQQRVAAGVILALLPRCSVCDAPDGEPGSLGHLHTDTCPALPDPRSACMSKKLTLLLFLSFFRLDLFFFFKILKEVNFS